MPPKKEASKKTEQKQKQKVVEDKTFGLKNKNKSKTVQKYIQEVQNQVQGQKKVEKDKKLEKEEEERKKLEKEIFKVAVKETKVPLGVDPKSVVCEFFKKGLCTKGSKCKFSHDVEQGRKVEKPDIYTDLRQDGEEEDVMDKWDQTKLEEVVSSKQTQENRNLKTTIVCKYFLQALEDHKYGWFWECPNGGEKCQYRHALPPGYVLKTKKKDEEEEGDEGPTIEEQIEAERAKLATRTPLTLEVFLKWKEDKKKKREKELVESKKKREEEIRSGKAMRSGREIFEFNPELFVDDEDVLDTEEFGENEDEGPVHYIEATETSLTRKTVGTEKTGEEGEYEVADYDEGNNKEEEEDIEESLFKEDEIPEDEE